VRKPSCLAHSLCLFHWFHSLCLFHWFHSLCLFHWFHSLCLFHWFHSLCLFHSLCFRTCTNQQCTLCMRYWTRTGWRKRRVFGEKPEAALLRRLGHKCSRRQRCVVTS
jgi:hypothetical protein